MSTRALRAFAAASAGLLLAAAPAKAFTISFEAADFGLNPTFSDVTTFSFEIRVKGPLAPGVYANPALLGVDYNVSGSLDPSPSGFPGFALVRSIGGAAFYAQGSSLSFEIDAAADLSDGLQLSELVGSDPVFVFDGRELGTGRYHPALVTLDASGTGTIQNSNNMGGVNPFNNMVVNVDFGDEYVTALTADPSDLTLVLPEPSSAVLLGLGLVGLVGLGRRLA